MVKEISKELDAMGSMWNTWKQFDVKARFRIMEWMGKRIGDELPDEDKEEKIRKETI